MNCKRFLILIFSFIVTLKVDAQDCTIPIALDSLNSNNVKTKFFASGSWWWDGQDGQYIYPKAPEGSGIPEVSAIFAGGLWVGGKDESGDLKLAAATYGHTTRFNSFTDYFPGPLDENGETTANTCSNFDRTFNVNANEIKQHISDFQSDGVINEQVSSSILGWPAIGNPNFFSIYGFDLPDNPSPLAPFVDQNHNGTYEPLLGDYPNIKFADQASWWVFNDNGIHRESKGDPLLFEFQMMAFSYRSIDPAINDATFYDLKIVNKSGENFSDVYSSLWLDPDLGCFDDDAFGCSPAHNLAFIYNQDEIDGDENCVCGCIDFPTYCDEIPIVGIKILKGMTADENGNTIDKGMSGFISYIQATEPTYADPPRIDSEYYNYMQSIWPDGSPITIGGVGWLNGNSEADQQTKFLYPAPPNDPDGWSLCDVFLNGFATLVISSGPANMPAGSFQELSFAVIAQPNVQHPCPDISGLIEIGEKAQTFYEAPPNTYQSLYNVNEVIVSPNPLTTQTIFKMKSPLQVIQSISLYSIDGKILLELEEINENTFTINRGDLTTGMHVYAIITSDGQLISGKLMVD